MTAPARDLGPKPELAWLDVDVLYVDQTYQRTMEGKRSQALIERIARDFWWPAFGAILVAPKKSDGIGNLYAVLDGQHRLAGARINGEKKVPCIIITADSVAQQARAFLSANRDRVIVNVYALHHAMMVAGDAAAQRIHQACIDADVEIPRYPVPANKLKPSQTLAIGAIKSIVEKTSTREATTALKVIRAAFPHEAGALRANFITGIHAALLNGALADIITARLARTSLLDFQRAVSDRAHGAGETGPIAVERLLSDGNSRLVGRVPAKQPAPVKPPAPKPVLRATDKPSVFQPLPDGASDAEKVAAHIAEKGVVKCPSAHVAPSDHARPAEFKTPADGLGPDQRASLERQNKLRTQRAQRIADFVKRAGVK